MAECADTRRSCEGRGGTHHVEILKKRPDRICQSHMLLSDWFDASDKACHVHIQEPVHGLLSFALRQSATQDRQGGAVQAPIHLIRDKRAAQAHRFRMSTLDSTFMCGSSSDIMALSETSDAIKNFEASAMNWLSMMLTQQTE